jgi:chemotaxis protein methyltransferase CheR
MPTPPTPFPKASPLAARSDEKTAAASSPSLKPSFSANTAEVTAQPKTTPPFRPATPPAFGQSNPATPTTAAASAPSPFRPATPPAFGQSNPATQTTAAAGAPSPFRSATAAATGQSAASSLPFRPFTSPTARPATNFGATRPVFQPRASQTPETSLRQPVAPFSAFRPQQPETNATSARAATPFRKDLQISNEEFFQLRDFIYQQCGIFIGENRKYLIENRLSIRIKDLNLKSYNEYYNYLRFDENRRNELTKLFEVVTTNETSFFRNPPQLDVFQQIVLTGILDQLRKKGSKRLRIWSAGCSSGEEPYTLAIILHEVLKSEISTWDIKITANDLSEAVLASAKRGVYSDYALRTTPPEIIAKYFTQDGNLYKINSGPKNLISFGQINLNDKEQCRRVEKSQIVFCRNVIIYFDDDMKRRVINAFYDNLEPGGALLIGHSESLHNINRAFQLEQHKGTMVYRKMG